MAIDLQFKKSRKKNRIIRMLILIVILAISTAFGILHQIGNDWVPPGVDAFCPFGGIEAGIYLIVTGTLMQRIAWSSFVLLLAVILVSILFRRAFCGTICPFGTLQEIFAWFGKFFIKKPLYIPEVIDKPARYIKYLVLVVFVVLSTILGHLVIRPYDPWATYHHIISPDIFTEFTIGFIVLIISLLGSVVFDRFFCKYLCPMGAFLGLINRIGLFRISRNNETCIHCNACNKACPVTIDVESKIDVHSSECLNCQLCVNACPVKHTLYVKSPWKKKIHPLAVSFITLGIFIVVVGIATTTGGFEWKLRTIEQTVQTTGTFNPEEIKGRDTWKEVSDLTGIPKEIFLKEFSITDEEFEAPIKDAAHKPGSAFDTEDVKEFVKKMLK